MVWGCAGKCGQQGKAKLPSRVCDGLCVASSLFYGVPFMFTSPSSLLSCDFKQVACYIDQVCDVTVRLTLLPLPPRLCPASFRARGATWFTPAWRC